MEIVEGPAALLSDFEVYQHLQSTSSSTSAASYRKKRVPQNVLTIEFEVLEYLKSRPCASITEARFKDILQALSAEKLTKAERLQLMNHLPRTAVEVHAIVEECEERYDDVDCIVEIFNKDL